MTQGSILASVRAARDEIATQGEATAYALSSAPSTNGHAAPANGAGANALVQALQQLQAQAVQGASTDIEARVLGVAQRELAKTATILREELASSIDAKLAGVKASADPAELQAAARAVLLAEIVDPASKAKALADGETELHPPVLPVDADYVQTECGEDIACALAEARPFVLVSGPSGSGKTFPIEQELRKAQRRYLKVSCADGVSRGELIGRMEASNGSTRWVDGVATRCARHGYALILDEIGKLDALVLASVQSLLDRKPSITTPWGEHLVPVAGFVVLGTCNALTDDTGLYVEQPTSADLPNRAAGALILAEYLKPDEERKILRQHVSALSQRGASRIVDDLGKLRELYRKGQLPAAPSLRVGLAVAEIVTGSRSGKPRAWRRAWDLAICAGLKPHDAATARGVLSSAAIADDKYATEEDTSGPLNIDPSKARKARKAGAPGEPVTLDLRTIDVPGLGPVDVQRATAVLMSARGLRNQAAIELVQRAFNAAGVPIP